MPPTPQRSVTSRSSSLSRISSVSSADEGRFVSGTLVAGRYRIIGLLGRGGMGEVYRATDLTLAQSVALKFLPETAARDQHLLERFHNEVRVARQVSHPNVCRVYDIGEADGLPYISMEYVDGEDLATLLQRIGRLPADKALEIARKICAGLAAAHARGVIHRDLKPQNIMLNKRGEVLVMDFGLAAVADQINGLEARHGTPAYQSPEQLRGDEVTPRSDIYAMGLIFYELFTGKRAYEAKTVAELLELQETARPVEMSTLAADVDPAVERAIRKCLQPDSTQRPTTPISVAAMLPGGDPLAAALAAGETPSPETVAAAGKTANLPLKYAVPSLAAILISLLVLPFLYDRVFVLFQSPMEAPPAVIENKAREISSAFGFTAKPKDWYVEPYYEQDYLRYIAGRPGSKDWRKLFHQESPMRFLYRESPRYLEATPDGAITRDHPPHTISGMTKMELDGQGRLRKFTAVPPQISDTPGSSTSIDPRRVFQAIGFDLAKFVPAEPRYTPVTAFETRSAWKGNHPEISDLPVSVEISEWRGLVTDVTMIWPWTKPTRMEEERETFLQNLGVSLYLILLAACVFWMLILARRNWRLGRGDRKGAFRLAVAFFLITAATWLFMMHPIPSFWMWNFLVLNMGSWILNAAMVWLLYMALEPAVRARWPQSIITWSRILSGRVNDPRVGAEVLFGMILGISFILMFLTRNYLAIRQGRPPDTTSLWPLIGTRFALGNITDLVYEAVQAGLIIIFLLFGLRLLLRRDYLAAVAAALLGTFVEGSTRNSMNPTLDIPVMFLIWAALTFVILRLGLLVAMVSMFTINLAGRIPLSIDFSAWYNSTGVLLTLILASLAIYAFWCSQRKVSAPSSA